MKSTGWKWPPWLEDANLPILFSGEMWVGIEDEENRRITQRRELRRGRWTRRWETRRSSPTSTGVGARRASWIRGYRRTTISSTIRAAASLRNPTGITSSSSWRCRLCTHCSIIHAAATIGTPRYSVNSISNDVLSSFHLFFVKKESEIFKVKLWKSSMNEDLSNRLERSELIEGEGKIFCLRIGEEKD